MLVDRLVIEEDGHGSLAGWPREAVVIYVQPWHG